MSIYELNHQTITFRSINPKKVEKYDRILGGLSLEDVKKDRMNCRHTILLDMAADGESPISDEYLRLRGIMYGRVHDILKSINEADMGAREAMQICIESMVKEQMFKYHGWVL